MATTSKTSKAVKVPVKKAVSTKAAIKPATKKPTVKAAVKPAAEVKPKPAPAKATPVKSTAAKPVVKAAPKAKPTAVKTVPKPAPKAKEEIAPPVVDVVKTEVVETVTVTGAGSTATELDAFASQVELFPVPSSPAVAPPNVEVVKETVTTTVEVKELPVSAAKLVVGDQREPRPVQQQPQRHPKKVQMNNKAKQQNRDKRKAQFDRRQSFQKPEGEASLKKQGDPRNHLQSRLVGGPMQVPVPVVQVQEQPKVEPKVDVVLVNDNRTVNETIIDAIRETPPATLERISLVAASKLVDIFGPKVGEVLTKAAEKMTIPMPDEPKLIPSSDATSSSVHLQSGGPLLSPVDEAKSNLGMALSRMLVNRHNNLVSEKAERNENGLLSMKIFHNR